MKNGCESTEKVKAKRSVSLPVLQNRSSNKEITGKSRVAVWRAIALITLNLLMIAHIIQWRLTGQTISPIEPSESMFTLQSGAVNAGFIFFVLAISATLIFGRFVCGWGCHVLALQDFCGWLLKKMGLTPKPFRSRLLVFVPLIVAFYMFVYPTAYRFFAAPKNEPIIPQFTNHLITTDFWATFPPIWVAIPFLFICGFMTVYFLGQKGFCTYVCPYGGFFNLADKVSPGKIRVTDACNQCGHCTAACTSNVLVHAEVEKYGMVVDSGCMKCMDCVSVCPNDALYFGFGKPSIAVKQTIKKTYSLTWAEELAAAVIFFASFMAVWDVYQLVPMLMALGIASISTFLALRCRQLIKAADLSFYRYNLKSSGKIKNAGFGFLIFSFVWLGLNTHSGWVHYNESAGSRAFKSLQIPDELALAQKNPSQWLGSGDRQNIAAGKIALSRAESTSLFTNNTVLPKLAWFEFLSGNTEQAVNLLSSAADRQEGQPKALSLYYRGAILNRLGRYEEAQKSLNQAFDERPDLVLALEEKGESLWQTGQKTEAVAIWKDALKANSNLVLTNYLLAGATASLGNIEESTSYEQRANQLTPNEPFFLWMIGLRLQNAGMNELAEKQFERAVKLRPDFNLRRNFSK
jgi:polyferredoxin/tetratricopeptide (TPR) repeat protein